jgi:LuxR family maltose regulon positive regulatory protein
VPLAHLLLDMGDLGGATAELTEIDALLRGRALPSDLAAGLVACRVRCHLLADDVAAAAEWASYRSYGEDLAGSFMAEVDGLTLTRVALAQRRLDDTVALLDRLERGARAGGRLGRLAEILALRTAALWAGGDRRGAEEALLAALAIAQPEHALRVFAAEADAIAPALAALALPTARRTVEQHGVSPDFLRAVRRAAQASNTSAGSTVNVSAARRHDKRFAAAERHVHPPTTLPEPLSERERQVLSLLAEGLSNQQIAERLIITAGTAKAHAHSIYTKLDVGGRVRAIARARELALL